LLREFVEKKIAKSSPDGTRTFFDTTRFPWVSVLESEWRTIRDELDAVLLHRNQIPNFQDVSRDQALLTQGDDWKTFFFYIYGHKNEENCRRCPETVRLLQHIPGMRTAMFSILAPRKHIPGHRGPYKGVLRYHLGLIVPKPKTLCKIKVGADFGYWEEGRSLIFDDSRWHLVWNDSDFQRVVLFVDFVRPLPFPLSVINRATIWKIGRTPFVTDIVGHLEHRKPASGKIVPAL
jgi:ornithine lipid ester-linked acyl 2-hydroxylase